MAPHPLFDHSGHSLERLGVGAPGMVLIGGRGGQHLAQHKGGHPLWVQGRHGHRDRRGIGPAHESSSIHAHGVHDRQDVGHHLVGAGLDRGPVGETGAPLVEQCDPPHRCVAFQKSPAFGQLPQDLEVGNPSDHQQDVERPSSKDLIGEIDPP